MANQTSAQILDGAALAKRLRAETRFRWYGRAAMLAALSMLAFLLLSLCWRGLPGFVRDAVNLDIAPGQYAQKVPLGHARTRIGRTLAHASVAMRGGWCDARVPFALLVDGTALVALAEDGTRTTLATVTAGYGVCAEFVEAQGAVYWSNGIERGRIVAGVNVPWGLPEPAAPGLSATSGTLAPGTYLVAVTHVNAAGEEGGEGVAELLVPLFQEAGAIATQGRAAILR